MNIFRGKSWLVPGLVVVTGLALRQMQLSVIIIERFAVGAVLGVLLGIALGKRPAGSVVILLSAITGGIAAMIAPTAIIVEVSALLLVLYWRG